MVALSTLQGVGTSGRTIQHCEKSVPQSGEKEMHIMVSELKQYLVDATWPDGCEGRSLHPFRLE